MDPCDRRACALYHHILDFNLHNAISDGIESGIESRSTYNFMDVKIPNFIKFIQLMFFRDNNHNIEKRKIIPKGIEIFN